MIRFKKYSRCILIIIFKLLLITSCTNLDSFSSSFVTSLDFIQDKYSSDQNQITRKTVQDIPFASALISFGGNQKSLLILESIQNNVNNWVSADQILFKEQNGRIIGTIGLPNDLYNLILPNVSFDFILEKGKYSYLSYYSFRKPELNNLKVAVTAEYIGTEVIDILGFKKEMAIVKEEIYAEKINWRFQNKFWIDPNTLFVWKSRQSMSPNIPMMDIEITKRPAN